MSSRDKILAEIKNANLNIAPFIHQEELFEFKSSVRFDDKVAQFESVVKNIGGAVIHYDKSRSIVDYLSDLNLMDKRIIHVKQQEEINLSLDEFYNTQVVIVNGEIGVAENGAIWVNETNMGNRLLPYACETLIIILNSKNIVDNLHQAYNQIAIDKTGYGVFIAGPSKTADIEQSLVIGAHGPLSFYVLLKNEL